MAEKKVMNGAGIEELGFPMWPQFAPETFEDVLEPLKTGKVSYWTGKKGMEFEKNNDIDNAIKYCNKGGKILVSTKVKNEKVIVSVYNNGPCIKEEDLKYIWDRFYKADKSRTNKTSTGLGLPIVRNIILQHNEEIWIDNTDKGVSFSFTLKRIKDD